MEPVHIHKSTLHKSNLIFLLIIPIIIFGLFLYLILVKENQNQKKAEAVNNTYVLGTQSKLDNPNK